MGDANIIDKAYVASTEVINSYGFRVLTSGIDTKRFKANPVCLSGHWNLVGKWQQFRKEDNKLMVQGIKFSRNERAQQVKLDVEDDIVSAVSIGFRIIETSNEPSLMLAGQKYPTVTKCELIEVSLVDTPSNPEAVGLKVYATDDEGKLTELSEKQIIQQLTFNKPMEKKNETPPAGADTPPSTDTLSISKLSADFEELRKENKMLQDKVKELEGKTVLSAKDIVEELRKDRTQTDTTGRENWTLADWKKKDYAGLVKLKTEKPAEYKALFAAAGVSI